jgi:ABC-type transporter Mla subunit MlaD
MPQKKHSEFTAGLFIIVALAALLGVVLWLGASELFSPAHQRAFFYADVTDGSTGLAVGNVVFINDLPVGKIVDIRPDFAEGRTLYEAKIEVPEARIHADAAVTVAAGLVGDSRLIVTHRGSDDKPLADAGNPVHITGGLDAAMRQLTDAVGRVNAMIATEFDPSGEEALLAKIHRIVTNIEDATQVISAIAATLEPETKAEDDRSMIVRIRESTGNIQAATANLRQQTEDREGTIVGDVSAISSNLKRETDPAVEGSMLGKVHKVVDDVKTITGKAEPNVDRLLTSAANTAEQIEQYSKKEIAEIFETLRKANDRILTIANDFAEVSDATKKIIVLNRGNIDRMIDNMAQVSESLKATANELRRNPWRLLHKPEQGEMPSYDLLSAASAYSAGASSLDQAMAKMQALDPDVIGPNDPQIQEIREHLAESFRRFKKAEDVLWEELQKQ